jgi:GNAT superfamily N-acetyltransferase
LTVRPVPPGLLGFEGKEPVAWCAVAPRLEYPVLARSRVLRPVDDTPVWSVSCLFVRKDHRQRGIAVAMLQAAVRFAARHGGQIVEGYPVVPWEAKAPDAFLWTGTLSAFQRAGFEEVARFSKTRPIVRARCTPVTSGGRSRSPR